MIILLTNEGDNLMMYEIPKEAFKQRLENKLNFALIDINENRQKEQTVLDGVEYMSFGDNFSSTFSTKYPDKTKNIVIFSLAKGDERPKMAAQSLSDAGYHFVYYYRGEPTDVVLDKGIN